MILQEILDRALEVAEEAEVYQVVSRETPAIFEANHLKSLETREGISISLRLIKDGRVGFASTTDAKDARGVVEHALEVAPFGPVAYFQFPEKGAYPDVPVYDPEVEQFPVSGLVELGQGVVDEVVARHPGVLLEGRVSKRVAAVSILNSRGAEAASARSVFSMGFEGMYIQGTDMLFVWEGESSCRPMLDTAFVRRSLEEQLELAKRVVPSVSGSLPVVFTPHGVAGTLVWPLLSGFNGRTVLQGASPLVGRLGEQVVDERVTLWDDPTLPYVPGSLAFDDEGVPTCRKPLLQGGMAKTFLYDLQTAGQARTASTGNAARWPASPPSPGASVVLLEEGKTSFRQMLEQVDEGLVVERLLGAGQGNVLAGDFNANVLLGYRVSHGKILGRVKNTVIAGNVYQVLNNVLGIGDESRWVGGWLKTPPLLSAGVSVSAKE